MHSIIIYNSRNYSRSLNVVAVPLPTEIYNSRNYSRSLNGVLSPDYDKSTIVEIIQGL